MDSLCPGIYVGIDSLSLDKNKINECETETVQLVQEIHSIYLTFCFAISTFVSVSSAVTMFIIGLMLLLPVSVYGGPPARDNGQCSAGHVMRIQECKAAVNSTMNAAPRPEPSAHNHPSFYSVCPHQLLWIHSIICLFGPSCTRHNPQRYSSTSSMPFCLPPRLF